MNEIGRIISNSLIIVRFCAQILKICNRYFQFVNPLKYRLKERKSQLKSFNLSNTDYTCEHNTHHVGIYIFVCVRIYYIVSYCTDLNSSGRQSNRRSIGKKMVGNGNFIDARDASGHIR